MSTIWRGDAADLLVVAPDPNVSGWCAEPIEIGVPGFVLRPPMLRRTSVPVATDLGGSGPPARTRGALCDGARRDRAGATIAAEVLPAIRELDDDRARFYYDLVYNSLHEATRRELEAIMKGYEYQTDFAKKYVAEGRAEGLTQGLTEGLTQGLTEGLTQGRAREAASNLLSVLRVRGIAVPDAVREHILAQKDPEQLERWLEKAVVATSVTEVIDEPS